MELILENIWVKLSGKDILKSINLKVEDGEFLSLLGASGCGKSTMLKTIAGIIPQNKGNIILGGEIANNIPTHKRKTVIVFQDFRLFPHMTVGENISFPLKMAGIDKNKCRETARELLKKVKLEGYEDRRINEISGGQMQRVALARALASEPVLLLLDEPFSSLDVNLRKEMRSLVSELQKEFKITTIMVTHDQEEALTMSDRIAFMHNGEIQQVDSPEKIFKKPKNKIVADYFYDGLYIDAEVKDGNLYSKLFKGKSKEGDGLYKCLVRPSAIEVIPKNSGNYKLSRKTYRGDSYLLLLENKNENIRIEALVNDSCKLEEGDTVDIEIKEEKLIYIPK